MNYVLKKKAPSDLIKNAITKNKTLTFQSFVYTFGSQGFGFMFIIISLPLVIPLPPGVGFIPALILMIWACQSTLGKQHLWLPHWLGRQVLTNKFIKKIETKAIPLCVKLEKICKPVTQEHLLKKHEIKFASLTVVFMSFLIMLPTPFLNTIPAIITIIMGLAILSGNRRLLWVNISLGLLTLVFIGSTLYLGTEFLIEELRVHSSILP